MGTPSIKKVGTRRQNYYGVRFRPPSQFVTIRNPSWARNVAQSESKGAEVVMGKTKAGNWLVQSVLIRRAPGKSKQDARRLAKRIVRKIES